MKKNKRGKNYWSPQLGNIKLIPESKTKLDFSFQEIIKTVIRILLALFSFTIPFVYLTNSKIYGIIIGIMLTAVFEISGFKQYTGLLELEETKEYLPLVHTGFWRLHRFLWYVLIFLFFVSIGFLV